MGRPERIHKSVPRLTAVLLHFWPWIRAERRLILLSIGALFAGVLFRLAEPWPLKFVLDRIVGADPGVASALQGLSSIQLLTAAAQLCTERKLKLTARRRQVLEILLASHQPMGAYDILAELNRGDSAERVAPPIVYRALDFLLAEGMIHRIESRNAFITCIHPGHRRGAQFLICRGCDRVAEIEGDDSDLLAEADSLGFAVDHSVVEITGICAECRKHVG